ncbi:tyrosine-type recombinase/integrase [Sulfitobacter sp. M57]|uniref:tyrosine-type recombinase/integrase n=1 Tax=unclassified Sulfitobacter TaxID=196795 RepID=UPI0023E3482E|nr:MULTISPECIES: tyrosine-type recombinase/integrase [unclassified Sulfitobacter]MDF3413307.1 tyrosine-type recombinase/integrase [Sulfitobacter sp. KE5]MDF3421413.1 tyrosine-type recombinase/integrase [Sulfitobacter sp. KE43]MDF3431854.1 tyrosine-type recombinase/integrase [Sulfitobacter sp. KE42]MDF3457494.1 tyrosine-type recombinase/integrase [Sulfitobacter sp. S74]MDF3461396.1 tyrosine-type recombinase/integrase [Sulfitobacter sp. Ks18]
MTQIVERKRKDGSTAYVAQINVRRNGKWAHRESRTFDKRASAAAWYKKRMKEIGDAGDDLSNIKSKGRTLSTAIDRYITESVKDIGRTKAQVLRSIREYDIAEMACNDIKSHDIVQFAKDLGTTRTPATVGNYLSHLSAIFAIARPAWGIPLDQQAMKDAFVVCNRLGITGKGVKRGRRPTLDELDALLTIFEDKHHRRPNSAPLHRIVGFALFSTRRQEEITRVSWEGLDQKHSRVFIKDMKHPGDKVGNDVWCDLPSPALKIALSMPKQGELVFPYNSSSISAAFTRTCKVLGIEDLRFHDLRHEGVTRLFEIGETIPQVAAVSGHRSWSSLQRYTHIKQTGDKYEGWEWLERLSRN